MDNDFLKLMWYKKFFKPKIKKINDFELPKRKSCKAEILISVYNNQKNIKECLQSVIPQLNEEIKLVIIDDSSSDQSSSIIEKMIYSYEENISFIKNKQNLGLSINLFRLVNSSNAIFCFRMDSDDIALDNRFSIQLEFMKKNAYIDILGSQAIYIDENEKVIGVSNKPLTDKDIKLNLYKNPLIHPTVIFKVESILKAGNYNYYYPHGQDYELWMRSAYLKLTFLNLEKPLIKYRVSKKPKYNFKTLLYELTIGIYWLPKLKSNFHNYFMITGRFFYRSILYFIYEMKTFYYPFKD